MERSQRRLARLPWVTGGALEHRRTFRRFRHRVEDSAEYTDNAVHLRVFTNHV